MLTITRSVRKIDKNFLLILLSVNRTSTIDLSRQVVVTAFP